MKFHSSTNDISKMTVWARLRLDSDRKKTKRLMVHRLKHSSKTCEMGFLTGRKSHFPSPPLGDGTTSYSLAHTCNTMTVPRLFRLAFLFPLHSFLLSLQLEKISIPLWYFISPQEEYTAALNSTLPQMPLAILCLPKRQPCGSFIFPINLLSTH